MDPRRSEMLDHAVNAAAEEPDAMPTAAEDALPDTSAVAPPVPRLPPELSRLVFDAVVETSSWRAVVRHSTLSRPRCRSSCRAGPRSTRIGSACSGEPGPFGLHRGALARWPGQFDTKDLRDVLGAPFGQLSLELRLGRSISPLVREAFSGAGFVRKPHPRLGLRRLALASRQRDWSAVMVPPWWTPFCDGDRGAEELKLGSPLRSLLGWGVPRVSSLRLRSGNLRIPSEALATLERDVRSCIGTVYIRDGSWRKTVDAKELEMWRRIGAKLLSENPSLVSTL